MAMISPLSVQKIIDAARIEDVLSDFMTLKKRGSNFIGNCPFHNEKTPSFSVSPAKGIYKCFGCGVSGTSVSFLMEHEQFSYPDALRFLAKKFHIEIEEIESSKESKELQTQIDSLYIVLQYAMQKMETNLWETDEGKAVGYSYLRERGFSDAIIKKFNLGYCLNDWQKFTDEAIKSGYALDNLVKAGLTKIGENQQYRDFYKGRVMFPIHNLSGKVIGFGGRKLTTQDNAPKYINTPESELYQKSKILYGISQARKAIRAEDHCLLVEGYTDVVSMHQGGVENVVASSGTALTVDQIKLIKKFTENIIILYDGDSAGVKAALRGLDMVLEAGMNLKMVLLPDNEDPDSYIRKEGAEKFKSFVEHNASDFILFKSKLILEEVKNDPVKKSELIGEIIESISKIPDPIRRSLYIKECSALLKVQEQLVINEVQKKKLKEFYDKQKLNANERDIIEQVVHSEVVDEVFQTDATSPLYACEREICRLLLEKGGDKMADSEHHLVHYVCENLEETVLKHPLYQVLYQHVKSLYKENTVLDLKYYLHHENEEIRKAAEEVTTYQYDLANWNNRDKDVQLPKWNENYSRDIIQAVARYKILLVTEMIAQNQVQLKIAEEEKNEEAVMLGLKMNMYLTKLRKELAKAAEVV